MKIAIIQFPGSNCERETSLAVQRAGMQPIEILWNEPPAHLADMDGFIIVGGFSYEDRSRAGIIAALDPLMQSIKAESEQGKPVLGICNGAQVLVESGLVPGLKNHQLGMALSDNKRLQNGKILGTGFYNQWIKVRTSLVNSDNAFTRYLSPELILSLPIAHAEGRFIIPDALLAEMQEEGLLALHYCDDLGHIIDEFPINPNGSVLNTAAIINKAGNVMAMMPHPERTPEGDLLFLSMRDYIMAKKPCKYSQLAFVPKPQLPTPYPQVPKSHQWLVKMIITDNHALTVQNTLLQLGIQVRVSRLVHWRISGGSSATLDQIANTGLLFNDRKEYLIDSQQNEPLNSVSYLVRAKEDLLGQQKKQMLRDHFAITEVERIEHGIVWIFTGVNQPISDLIAPLLATHIIHNPYSHECYDYDISPS